MAVEAVVYAPCVDAKRPDVVEIGDVCGEVEKRVIAILRAAKFREVSL